MLQQLGAKKSIGTKQFIQARLILLFIISRAVSFAAIRHHNTYYSKQINYLIILCFRKSELEIIIEIPQHKCIKSCYSIYTSTQSQI